MSKVLCLRSTGMMIYNTQLAHAFLFFLTGTTVKRSKETNNQFLYWTAKKLTYLSRCDWRADYCVDDAS